MTFQYATFLEYVCTELLGPPLYGGNYSGDKKSCFTWKCPWCHAYRNSKRKSKWKGSFVVLRDIGKVNCYSADCKDGTNGWPGFGDEFDVVKKVYGVNYMTAQPIVTRLLEAYRHKYGVTPSSHANCVTTHSKLGGLELSRQQLKHIATTLLAQLGDKAKKPSKTKRRAKP